MIAREMGLSMKARESDLSFNELHPRLFGGIRVAHHCSF